MYVCMMKYYSHVHMYTDLCCRGSSSWFPLQHVPHHTDPLGTRLWHQGHQRGGDYHNELDVHGAGQSNSLRPCQLEEHTCDVDTVFLEQK